MLNSYLELVRYGGNDQVISWVKQLQSALPSFNPGALTSTKEIIKDHLEHKQAETFNSRLRVKAAEISIKGVEES